MSDIIEDYLRRVEDALAGEPEHARAVVREIRAHLTEKADDMMRADPTRDADVVAREVVDGFGDPDDLALAYRDGEPTAVRNRNTNEVVLEVGRAIRDAGKAAAPHVAAAGRSTAKAARAVGRGLGGFIKVVAIVLAALLVLALGAGVWAFYEVKPLIEKNVPVPVFSRSDWCDDDGCNLTRGPLTFYVHGAAREVRLDMGVHHDEGSLGAYSVNIRNPNGTLVYSESFPANATHNTQIHQAWSPLGGDWTIEMEYIAFKGHVDLDILTVGLPPESL